MRMLTRFLRRRAIRTYFEGLLSRLRCEQGLEGVDGTYSADYVLATIHQYRFNDRYARYAVAMYCNDDQYELERIRQSWPDTYDSLRAEIGTVIRQTLDESRATTHWPIYLATSIPPDSTCHHSHHGDSSGHGQC